MTIRYDEVLKFITLLSEVEHIQVSVKGALQGGFLVGFITMIVSLLLGPIGFIFGGFFGGSLSYYMSSKFKPLPQIISEEMKPEERQKLVDCVSTVLQDFDSMDAIQLLALVQGNEAIKKGVISQLQNVLSQQYIMNCQL